MHELHVEVCFGFKDKLKVHIFIPCKRFFSQLVANYVHNVATKVDANGLSYAKKVMICCGFSIDINGIWHLV